MSEESFYKAKEIYGETFYQLPKVLFTNPLYKGISNDAKVAYALLKDRFNYSIRNNWVDENDNIYFIFTNDELMSLLSSGNQKVIKIKKELDSVGLLLQKRMGVNKPNHLYLLRPEVEATDVYKQVNSSNVDTSGNVKITLPENVDTSGNVKITRNLYLQPLDTNIDTNIDTAKLDFSSKNFSQSEIKKQNEDLVSNAYKYLTGENVDNSMPFEPETIQLISYWVRTPEQMRSFIGIILNARKDIQADIEKQTGRPVTIIMDTEPKLQKGITTTLRRYFNSMRNTDNKNKKINSPENYLYISMKNYFGYWYNSVMAKRNKEASN
ncbi:replication initiator protein A [Leuconostoc mesenteroides]|uniref:replication initiator protein A n=1 Tax=Leuconostoc mesenteroides TaxID=1245 RepID=UPI002361FE54|nr:replication initiator protein A [Leuconostoc mesenteroides]